MRTATLLLAGSIATLAPFARSDNGDIRIEDLRLGEYWYGSKISLDDLKGKVVLFETWGS